jgi:hypothetical protein
MLKKEGRGKKRGRCPRVSPGFVMKKILIP